MVRHGLPAVFAHRGDEAARVVHEEAQYLHVVVALLPELSGHRVGHCGDVLVEFRVRRALKARETGLANLTCEVRNQVGGIKPSPASARRLWNDTHHPHIIRNSGSLSLRYRTDRYTRLAIPATKQ